MGSLTETGSRGSKLDADPPPHGVKLARRNTITPAFCFGHARRGFFELADIAKKARDGVKGKPLLDVMQAWLLRERETLSRSA